MEDDDDDFATTIDQADNEDDDTDAPEAFIFLARFLLLLDGVRSADLGPDSEALRADAGRGAAGVAGNEERGEGAGTEKQSLEEEERRAEADGEGGERG